MANGNNPDALFEVNTRLLAAGAVLAGVGSMIGAAGLLVSGAALAEATRRWFRNRGQPPGALARQQFARARAATAAGANAWRESPAGAPAR